MALPIRPAARSPPRPVQPWARPITGWGISVSVLIIRPRWWNCCRMKTLGG